MNNETTVESVLTDSERAEVLAYVEAPAQSRDRNRVRSIYAAALSRGATTKDRADPYFQYLSEVFNPAPDLGFRASLAARIIESRKAHIGG